MYLTHYGLNQSPFGITPNPAFFYVGNKRGAILDALIYAVTHGEGITKVTGEVGSGKTMLCRMLESQLPDNVVPIYLVNPTLTREEVVYAIAGELGLATGGKRPDEVIRLVQSDLIAKHINGKQVVLLIEEAQAMPLDTLEEIRLFSNLETAHHKLLQIVLFGQPELDESLKLPRMRQLKERITHSFKVPPMEPDVIPEFLMFRMRTAGYHGPDIFSKGALKLISAVSEGIVRRISILADKSLLAAFADNSHAIEARHVRAAIEDSEFSSTAAAKKRRTLMLAGLILAGALLAAFLAWQPFAQRTANTPTVSHQPATVAAAPAVANTTEQPVSIEKNAAPSPAPVPTAAADPTAEDLLRQRLASAKTWLQNEDARRFSIQLALMDAAGRPQIEQYMTRIESELGNQPLHLYPTRIGGVARFGILYGSYLTLDEAIRIRAKISKYSGNRPPQIRTVQGIRTEISKSRSDDLWPL